MKDQGEKLFLLCGILFALIGALFLGAGAVMFKHMDALYENGSGDVAALPFIFSGLGAVLLVVGILLLLYVRRKVKKARRLIDDGVSLVAEVTAVTPDYTVRINGFPTFRAECRYQDPVTGVIHVFKSGNLARNPGDALIGEKVTVYIDRYNHEYKDYYVDIESLLPEVIVH